MSDRKAPRPVDIARAAWEDRHASLALERDRWMRATFASLGLAAVATGFGIWAAFSTEYVPYVVTVDELNRPAAALAPREITDWDDEVVRHELAEFVRDWRSVSSDARAMEGRLRRIQYLLEPGSAGNRKVIEWAKDPDTSPVVIARTHTADVAIVAVNLLGGRSWLVEWTETRRGLGTGRAEAPRRFQGTFVLGRRAVRDAAVLLRNPLGMVVEDFDIVRTEG
ncbi:MAG: type IV secretion system protein [Boseongicola sp.]|nr:type IV secretion system protein [Boseongicola sp.]